MKNIIVQLVMLKKTHTHSLKHSSHLLIATNCYPLIVFIFICLKRNEVDSLLLCVLNGLD